MAQIPRNMQTMQHNLKKNVFHIIESMINNTCHSSICYNLFRASKQLFGASKSHFKTTCPLWQVSSEIHILLGAVYGLYCTSIYRRAEPGEW